MPDAPAQVQAPAQPQVSAKVQVAAKVQAPTKSRPRTAPAGPRTDVALFDPAFTSGYVPGPFRSGGLEDADFVSTSVLADTAAAPTPIPDNAPLKTASADVPLPLPRPAFRPLIDTRPPSLAPPVADHPSFFARIFGDARRDGPALAYAAPDDGGVAGLLGRRRPSTDARTAVYDVAAHTVTLPSGARLEAHSGLGASYDNPQSVTEHMRGATPPAAYDLTLREGLFHGVQALRLSPSDPGATYGRMGLLAHSYMLGPRGESNGCVVFRNYAAFLRAYESGEIRRLVVVSGTT